MNSSTRVSAWHSTTRRAGKSFSQSFHHSLSSGNYRSILIESISYTTCLAYGGRQYSKLFSE